MSAVTIVDTGSVHDIHAAKCADLKPSKYRLLADAYTVEFGTSPALKDCIDALYGPDSGSFYADSGLSDDEGWRSYVPYFKVFPCAGLVTP